MSTAFTTQTAAGRARISVMAIVAVGTLVLYTAIGIIIPTLPRWTEVQVSGSGSAIGTMAIAYTVGAIGCRPMLARMGPYISQRHMVILGALITAIGVYAHRLTTTLPGLWAARIIVAIGETFAYLGMSTLVTTAAGSRAAEAMSYNSAALFAGLGLGPLIGDPLSKQQRWNLAFGIPVGLCLVLVGVMVLLKRYALEPPRPTSQGSRLGLHGPSIRPGLVLGFLVLGEATWANYLTPYADQLQISGVGLRLAVFSFSVLVLRVALARVPARVGLRSTAIFSVSMIAVALILLGVIGGSVGLWVSTAAAVVGMAQMFPALIGLTLEREPDPARHALAMSTFTMFFEIGAAMSGLSGFVADRSSYETAYLAAGLLTTAGIPLLLIRAGTWGQRPVIPAR
jgi:predicted MFS family arabinose efflux permease